MPRGVFERKSWQKISSRFRKAVGKRQASPAENLEWVHNAICRPWKEIDSNEPPSLAAVRLLIMAKDDKTYPEFLSLWQRMIPPSITKRDGFSDDGRHTFPLIEAIERELRDQDIKQNDIGREPGKSAGSALFPQSEGVEENAESAEGFGGESTLSQGAA